MFSQEGRLLNNLELHRLISYYLKIIALSINHCVRPTVSMHVQSRGGQVAKQPIVAQAKDLLFLVDF